MEFSTALTASEAFTKKNLHRSHAENVDAMKKQTALHLKNGVDVPRIGVMAAFGCNYQGDITPAQVDFRGRIPSMTLTLEDFTDAGARDLSRRLKKAPPAAGLESLFAARETDGSKRRQ